MPTPSSRTPHDDVALLEPAGAVDVPPGRGEFCRVGEQIDEHLGEARHVPFHGQRLGRQQDGQFVTTGVDAGAGGLRGPGEDLGQIHGLSLQRELPLLDPGHVEQIVHQAGHLLGLPPDSLPRLPARRAFTALQRQEAGGGDDRREVVAQLV